MNKITIILSAIVCVVAIFSSCDRADNTVEYVLTLAGDNRSELEKVLAHYSADQNDTLKYKAACFLIENMPGHYSYLHSDMDFLYREVDSIYTLDINPERKMEMVDSILICYPDFGEKIIEDYSIISADYLICNIEDAFTRWKLHYCNSGLSFEDFCEYILPYKTVELQALDHWRDTLRAHFPTRFSDDEPYYGEFWRFSHYGASVVTSSFRNYIINYKPLNRGYNHPRLLDARIMSKIPYGLCDDYSIILVSLLRSCGIPAALCYVPMWSDQNNGHTFISILCNGNKKLPMIWGYESNPGDAFPVAQICAKIYQYTYAPDERAALFEKNSAYIYPGFTVFQKDITNEFISTCDNLEVDVYAGKEYGKYAYIATFNADEWQIQDFGKLKGNKAYFQNMGKEIAYLILGYNGKELKPISNPFLLHWDGSVEYVVPDNDSLMTIDIARKFPQKDLTIELERRVVGGRIQASNQKDFKNCKTIYTIDTLAGSLVKTINTDKPYRYWRFLSSDEGWCNFSELQFYEKGDTSYTAMKGKIIGTLDSYMKDPYWDYKHAFDGDWLTGFHYKEQAGGWIGLDFGEPVHVGSFLCVPRSDDNGIHLNDKYELLYWGDGAWRSLGCQSGKEWTMQFKNVPYNSLLLLKNHTRGKQERPFIFRNGRQEWW